MDSRRGISSAPEMDKHDVHYCMFKIQLKLFLNIVVRLLNPTDILLLLQSNEKKHTRTCPDHCQENIDPSFSSRVHLDAKC